MSQDNGKLVENLHEKNPYIFNKSSFVDKNVSAFDNKHWSYGISPHDRMFYHQTFSSALRSKNLKKFDDVPKDSLDFALCSQYNHEQELFVNKSDVILQPKTVNKYFETKLDVPHQNISQVCVQKRLNELCHPLAIGMSIYIF